LPYSKIRVNLKRCPQAIKQQGIAAKEGKAPLGAVYFEMPGWCQARQARKDDYESYQDGRKE